MSIPLCFVHHKHFLLHDYNRLARPPCSPVITSKNVNSFCKPKKCPKLAFAPNIEATKLPDGRRQYQPFLWGEQTSFFFFFKETGGHFLPSLWWPKQVGYLKPHRDAFSNPNQTVCVPKPEQTKSAALLAARFTLFGDPRRNISAEPVRSNILQLWVWGTECYSLYLHIF